MSSIVAAVILIAAGWVTCVLVEDYIPDRPVRKETPCDTCKHLRRKYGFKARIFHEKYRYDCHRMDKEFDDAPEYCWMYERRE